MTQSHTTLGANRTGIATAPRLTAEMLEGSKEFSPDGAGDQREIALARTDVAREAEPVGSVPPPPTLKGMLKSAAQVLKGESPTLFIDKLGERLAFERTGVRVYEAALSKLEALGSFEGGPSRGELEAILADEFAHFILLQDALRRLGADPTVMTPSADIHATIGKGAVEVVVDPRTTLLQTLEAVLVIELADNECWDQLTQLAAAAGQVELAHQFAAAGAEEQEHLAKIRRYVAAAKGL
ncbi:MAG TPA: ferritin-like domain-containing protein [Polyangiales bacterium]